MRRRTCPTSRATKRASPSSTMFKEVQRLKTQLDQYTDLTRRAEQAKPSSRSCPRMSLQGFRGVYLETAQRLKEQQDKQGDDRPAPMCTSSTSSSSSLPPPSSTTTTSWG